MTETTNRWQGVFEDVRSFGVEIGRLFEQLRRQGPGVFVLAAIDKIGRKLSGRPVMRYSRITPQLILGGQPARRRLPRLSALGITGVVNLRDELDYVDDVGDVPLRYLYLPTIDNTPPTLEHLHEGVAFITREIDEGGIAYIHCWEGLGRGPTMAAAYFVSQGMTPDDAWAHIRRIRPFIRPTRGQVAQLEAFAADLREREITHQF